MTWDWLSKDIKTMDDLLLHGLQDIYYAEQQIIRRCALPKMIDQAPTRDLAHGLKTHLSNRPTSDIDGWSSVQEALRPKPSGSDCRPSTG